MNKSLFNLFKIAYNKGVYKYKVNKMRLTIK